MDGKPLYILLCSGEHEKVQMAAMMASVAAVSGRPAQVFVSMNAVPVFERDRSPEERYQGGTFSRLMLEKKAPDAIELFQQGKMLGEMQMYACSMALDVLGWELDRLVPDLFDGALGLTKFLSDAEQGELITL
ncbi:DsrE/DsrF/DrsH-like family protein [Inmirania thermothiophila]|uniref:Peroxiredoxin family protein n=1 Tax=Inmirania thermothiophila TaxID=1750597 RepID=A0A3N1Y0J0_9GAMM|nr:DsrE/DsrF/DrsH-like family protein [Inmirania thermothiophila]ROR32354.1 peroxiredoxin family protein [Inmirania thermothiophila]